MSEQVGIYFERDYYARPEQLPELSSSEEVLLTEEQIQEVIDFEHQLYDLTIDANQMPKAAEAIANRSEEGRPLQTLHDIWKIKINKTRLGIDYFLSDEGRSHLQTAVDKQFTASDVDDAATQVAVLGIEQLPSKTTDELQAKSIAYAEKLLVESYIKAGLQGNDISAPSVITITKNPQVILEKARGYRELKQFIKLIEHDIVANDDAREVKAAKQFITSIYRHRINNFMSSLYVDAYQLHYQNQVRGDGHYTELLEEISGYLPAFKRSIRKEETARFLQRIDRFQQGIVRNNDGTFGWLSPAAKEIAQTTQNKGHEIINRGVFESINPEDLHKTKADGTAYAKWAKEILAEYGLLSDDNDWNSEREGPPSDGKWQVVVNDKYKSLAVTDKQRVLKVPAKERPLFEQAYLLEHELTHVMQHSNKRLLSNLKITEEIGADNTSMQAEAGALWREALARETMSGETHATVSGTSYMAALAIRAKGGTFGQCMQAFYEDFVCNNPGIDKETAIARAANRTQRIYRKGGFEYAEGLPYLTDTQPLHYLEQAALAKKLRGEQRKILLVAGIGLHTLAVASRLGLADLKEIKLPQPSPIEIAGPNVVAHAAAQ